MTVGAWIAIIFGGWAAIGLVGFLFSIILQDFFKDTRKLIRKIKTRAPGWKFDLVMALGAISVFIAMIGSVLHIFGI